MRLAVCILMVALCLFRSTAHAFTTSSRRHLLSHHSSRRPITRRAMSASSLYWNREESPKQSYNMNAPIIKQAKIISLSAPDDDANVAVNTGPLPEGASLLAVGTSMDDFSLEQLQQQEPNVIFVAHPEVLYACTLGRKHSYSTILIFSFTHSLHSVFTAQARQPLADLLDKLPTIEWVHMRSAGIDFCTSPTLSQAKHVVVTNAKGQFSSTLAEYTMMACSYFAKNVPRLQQQKSRKEWIKYSVLELRGATLGIVGFGDIGRACAKLATAYGMRVVALRRHATPDPLCDIVYSNTKENFHKLMSTSDYILCSAPLTDETRGLFGSEAFQHAKDNAVFINVGRGPIVDENALIEALKNGKLKGAALDVFDTEPLPETSELWTLPNVLISPHNMDQTETFMHEATEFFVQENLPRFVRGETLLNPVDPAAGY